jgi:integrase
MRSPSRRRRGRRGQDLPRQRFHDARHSVATFWLELGIPTRVVADLLGHSQVSLTMNVYQHVVPTMRKEASDRLEAMYAGSQRD